MTVKVRIDKNAYHDSVTLMSLSNKISSKDGVEDAVVSMGTEMNIELLENIDLLTDEAKEATENDLIIAIRANNEETINESIELVDSELGGKKSGNKKSGDDKVQTMNAALNNLANANMAIISVPGEYAAREARNSLKNGLNVMMFSDNVSIEDELELKKMGREKGLLVMGPDCGTAIINNNGLCFANAISKGNIGLVAASGTGLQEVTVQIDRMGYGITQAIGTGGRDLSEDIGGIMMLESIDLLEADENTKVITLISKPPAKSVQDKIVKKLETVTKPVVVCFLDGDAEAIESDNVVFSSTLYDAAVQSIKQLDPDFEFDHSISSENLNWVKEEASKLAEGQKYIRALFGGGTLTSETLSVLRSKGEKVRSNVAKIASEKLEDLSQSVGHTLLDMGEDEFTQGRPHPMIEPSLRNDRIIEEANDPETAVLLLDFETGFGAHEDPVGESIDTLIEAKEIAESNGRHLPIVSYICGTNKDKQGYSAQKEQLEKIGAIVATSNSEAAEIAQLIISKEVH